MLQRIFRQSLAITFAFFFTATLFAQSSNKGPSTSELFDRPQPHGFDWMLVYDNKPTSALVKDAHFIDLDKYVLDAPKVKYDFDGPGTQVLLRDKFTEVLAGTGKAPSAPDNVKVRLGRYVTASSCNGEQCQARAFLWIDAVAGVGLCVLIHPSLGDLPSKGPALLIYSRQLKRKLLIESDLPDQFWLDFRDWAYNKRLPPVMTQRYVNEYSAVQVLLHDQEFCLDAYSTRDAEECNQTEQDAADADLQALLNQIESHKTEDASARALINETEEAWKNYRDKACKAVYKQFDGGTGAPVAEGECSVRITKEHVRGLQKDYFTVLFD